MTVNEFYQKVDGDYTDAINRLQSDVLIRKFLKMLPGDNTALCPTNAIPQENPRMTDESKCISCMRCIAVCPQNARKINPLKLFLSIRAFKEKCETRKEPELFI